MSNDWFDFFTQDDEQKSAMDKVEDLIDQYKKDYERDATHLYVSDHEELQSYMLWAGMALNLQVQRTAKRHSYVTREHSTGIGIVQKPKPAEVKTRAAQDDRPNTETKASGDKAPWC